MLALTPAAAAVLLALIAVVTLAILVSADRGPRNGDGPWSVGVALLAGLSMTPSAFAHESIYPAQDKGSCVQAALVAASADIHLDAGQRGGGSLPCREPRERWALPGRCASWRC